MAIQHDFQKKGAQKMLQRDQLDLSPSFYLACLCPVQLEPCTPGPDSADLTNWVKRESDVVKPLAQTYIRQNKSIAFSVIAAAAPACTPSNRGADERPDI